MVNKQFSLKETQRNAVPQYYETKGFFILLALDTCTIVRALYGTIVYFLKNLKKKKKIEKIEKIQKIRYHVFNPVTAITLTFLINVLVQYVRTLC